MPDLPLTKLDTLTLSVKNPAAQQRFYCEVLGMSDRGEGRLAYAPQEIALRFVAADAPYVPRPSDLYWKIALSVPNIDLAYKQLQKAGVSCTAPVQFRDVGYLAKITDPEGFTVELIDHWFEGERPEEQHDETLLGGGAHLSLLTLRTADIAAVEPEILNLGMTPLSVQPVDPYGFTLHFYAFTDEQPPNENLEAVENRTWVYRRPYTVLEIQHVHALTTETTPSENVGGYSGVTIRSADPLASYERLKITAERS
ncbi:VOC family protein [Rhodobacteraceae bacterium]|nr:VOC family protein [Paracoccaceae bacterium]